MSPEPASSGSRTRGPRLLFAATAVVLVLVAVSVYFGIPNKNGGGASGNPGASASFGRAPVVGLKVTIESINATSGFAMLRISAAPNPEAMPKDGIVVFSSLGNSPAIPLRPDQLIGDSTAQLPFSSGNVADYPFDRYTLSISFLVVAGTNTSVASLENRTALPFELTGVNDVAGIDASEAHTVKDKQVDVNFVLTRGASTKGWVLAMMAIYWLLALGALAVSLSIVGKFRPWETRQLAWLSALLFALSAFRAAAPATPPIGTFLDFYAVFEAIGIVAVSLMSLMAVYLVRSRDQLGL